MADRPAEDRVWSLIGPAERPRIVHAENYDIDVAEISTSGDTNPRNARLIESAPNLYALLDEALYNNYPTPSASDPMWVKEARAYQQYIDQSPI